MGVFLMLSTNSPFGRLSGGHYANFIERIQGDIQKILNNQVDDIKVISREAFVSEVVIQKKKTQGYE